MPASETFRFAAGRLRPRRLEDSGMIVPLVHPRLFWSESVGKPRLGKVSK